MHLAERDRLGRMAQDLMVARVAQASDGKAVQEYLSKLIEQSS
jgi:hypothetical protein